MVALYIVTLPFTGVRELYWAFDRDAKVRSKGLQTIGRVERKRTKTDVYKDPESGKESTTYTYFASYSFPVDGLDRRDEKKVGSCRSLRGGSSIKVYFLPNGNRFDSALDWTPALVR